MYVWTPSFNKKILIMLIYTFVTVGRFVLLQAVMAATLCVHIFTIKTPGPLGWDSKNTLQVTARVFTFSSYLFREVSRHSLQTKSSLLCSPDTLNTIYLFAVTFYFSPYPTNLHDYLGLCSLWNSLPEEIQKSPLKTYSLCNLGFEKCFTNKYY